MATKTSGKGIYDEKSAALIEELQKDYPESWIPQDAGDNLVGYFVGLDQGRTPFGPAWIVVLDVKGTHRSVWLLHEALRSQFLQQKPVSGELVAIMYRGKRAAKNPTLGRSETYHDYRVAVDRGSSEASALTWEGMEGSTEAPVSEDDIPF